MSELFYIASLKHTRKDHEHIVWWQKNSCGYTPVLGEYCGEYTAEQIAKDLTFNDGVSCLAVSVEVVKALMQPEPYHQPEGRFYDQRGPVLDNTRANWNRLIAAAKPFQKLKPECFRGKRRSFPATHFEQRATHES